MGGIVKAEKIRGGGSLDPLIENRKGIEKGKEGTPGNNREGDNGIGESVGDAYRKPLEGEGVFGAILDPGFEIALVRIESHGAPDIAVVAEDGEPAVIGIVPPTADLELFEGLEVREIEEGRVRILFVGQKGAGIEVADCGGETRTLPESRGIVNDGSRTGDPPGKGVAKPDGRTIKAKDDPGGGKQGREWEKVCDDEKDEKRCTSHGLSFA
jgi:hypothetical protein